MSKRPKHRLARFALIVVSLAAIAWFAIPRFAGPFLRSKLESLVGDHLHATIAFGGLSYSPPYSLSATNVRIASRANPDNALSVEQLDLTLVQSPFRAGPLLIERIALREPKLQIHRAQRFDESHATAPAPTEAAHQIPTTPAAVAPPASKLSDAFRLRSLAIESGQIIYGTTAEPASPPMIWKNLGANLAILPQSAADYQFTFTAEDGTHAKLSADGSLNIDTLLVSIAKLSIAATMDPGKPTSSMPAQIQQVLKERDLSGSIALNATGQLPLRDARNWTIPDLSGVITLAGGGGSMEFNGSLAPSMDQSKLNVVLNEVTHRPPAFAQPIERANGTVRLAQNVVSIDELKLRYGADDWNIKSARMALNDLSEAIRFDDIDAAITFGAQSAPYPAGFGRTITALQPSGAFTVRGTYLYNKTFEGFRNQYDLIVATDGGNLAPGPRHIPIERVHCSAHVTRTTVEIPQLTADVFGGNLMLAATIDPRSPLSYRAQLSIQNADLSRAWDFFQVEGPSDAHVTGRADLTATVSSDSTNLASLISDGEFQIFDAQMWEGKILSHVAREVQIAEDRLGAADAAAVFHIEDGAVQLNRLAIHARELGVQGSGTVDFGGAIDISLAAAPLGDLQQHMQRSKIPIIGDVAGALVGGFQKVLNTATRQLLYEFRVTGTTVDPKFEVIPAPILTNTAAGIFAAMIKGEGPLINAVRGQEPAK